MVWCSVMNGPIISIARELGFEGNSILEGLVVSIFIAGAFLGSSGAGYLVDRLGFRRTLQVDTIPLILGAVLWYFWLKPMQPSFYMFKIGD